MVFMLSEKDRYKYNTGRLESESNVDDAVVCVCVCVFFKHSCGSNSENTSFDTGTKATLKSLTRARTHEYLHGNFV